MPDCLIHEGKGSVKVLKSHDRWYGMTYREDLPIVREALSRLTASGLYPEGLWQASVDKPAVCGRDFPIACLRTALR